MILLGQVVNRYIDEGIAELVPGVLFVDEVHFCKPIAYIVHDLNRIVDIKTCIDRCTCWI